MKIPTLEVTCDDWNLERKEEKNDFQTLENISKIKKL